ncbi:PI31 proteasome regulator N-terminal-domain-containing protein [Crassisporium funariophilum]|nr:PI31 proteasome regulator N-terminal-domain-containing protein [Crassisporium funariophilum]
MTVNILDPSAVLALLSTLLPEVSKSLASPQDAIAALLHAAFTALAFRLISVDEDSSSLSSSGNVLPVGWNKDGPGHYTFKYKHDQSSLVFLVRLSKLGTRTLVNAIALESDKVATLDVSTNDFTSPSFYPHDLEASNASPLVHGFISSNRVSDLMSQFKLKIIQNLLPGLQKEGYTEVADATSTGTSSNAALLSQDQRSPRPRPVTPPDAPDRYAHYPPSAMPRNPLEIGRRDLDPFPTNPFAPPSLFPHGSGDGMYVGPDHPIFGFGRTDPSAERRPWGGDGFLPPMGAPPGARFDPVGPLFPGRNGLGRGGRTPGAGNMRGPDNDEFMPPGMGDMFM